MTNEEFLKRYSTMAGSDKAIANKDKAFLYKSCTVAGSINVIDEYCKADEPVVGPTGETGTTGSTGSTGSTESVEKEQEQTVETQSAKSVKKSTKKVVVDEQVAE